MKKLTRDDMPTELSKLIYDWSAIMKPTFVDTDIRFPQIENICEAFFMRNKMVRQIEHIVLENDGLYIVRAAGIPSLMLDQDWTNSFLQYGLYPPLLDIEDDEGV